MADTRLKLDPNRKNVMGAIESSSGDIVPVLADDTTGRILVDATLSGSGTTQYTEGDTDASITGTAMMMEGAGNALVAAQGTATDGLLVNLGTNNDVTITGTVAVTQSGTWDEVGINDSGNSITIDNAQLSVVGGGTEATAMRVTIASDSTGVLSVDDNGSSLTVDGTVAVSSVGGSVAVTNAGLTELESAINASSQVDVNIAASAVDVMLGTDFSAVMGTASLVLATQADDLVNTTDTLLTSALGYVFDGTTWDRLKGDATNGMLVNLGSNNDVTVTGTVDLGATDNAVLDAIAASVAAIDTDTTTIIGHVDGIEALLTTIDADTGNMDTSLNNIETSVQLLDDTIFTAGTDTYTETSSKGQLMLGVRRDADTTLANTTNEFVPFQVDANGYLKVEIFDGGGTHTVDQATHDSLNLNANVQQGDADVSSTNELYVRGSGTAGSADAAVLTIQGIASMTPIQVGDNSSSLTVDNGGTFVVQENGAALTALQLIDNIVYVDDADWTDNTSSHALVGGVYQSSPHTVTDGDVTPFLTDVNGRLAIADGGGTITVDGTITANLSATDNTVLDNIDADTSAIQTAVELIDDTVYVDDADWTADTSKHVLVGAVTQIATTVNTDGDVTPLTTNSFRELRVAVPESDLATATTSHVKKYYTNAGAVTDGIIWSPAAGKRWYVTDIFIQVSAAATVTLEDDLVAGDAAIWKAELAANSGWSHSFQTPWYSGEDAADLIITTTAGNVYVTVTGYEI